MFSISFTKGLNGKKMNTERKCDVFSVYMRYMEKQMPLNPMLHFIPPPPSAVLVLPRCPKAACPENMSPIPVIMSPLLWSCGTMHTSHTRCPLPQFTLSQQETESFHHWVRHLGSLIT